LLDARQAFDPTEHAFVESFRTAPSQLEARGPYHLVYHLLRGPRDAPVGDEDGEDECHRDRDADPRQQLLGRVDA
jgi:hypothetical protein